MKITRLSTGHPWAVVVLVLLVTIFFGYFAKGIERDHSNDGMLPPDEPIRAYFDEFQKHFDIRSKIVIGIHHDQGVFTPEVLAQVDRVATWLENYGEIDEVRCLTTQENITAEDGVIVTGPLVEEPPQTPEEVASLKAAVYGNSLLVRGLLSADEKATLIIAQPAFQPYETKRCKDAYHRIQNMLVEDPGPGTAHFAGFPMIIGLTDEYMDRDSRVMLPIICLMVTLLLFISFRSLRGVWIPLAVVVGSVVWTYGAMHLAGVKINIISSSIPIILVAMGIADGIHIIHEYYHHLRRGHDNLTAVHDSMREMNSPVIMTSVTTAAGFLALATSTIVPIREYGIAVAFGVMTAMIFSVTFIPACLALLGAPKKILSAKVAEQGLLDRFSVGLGDFSMRHAKGIILLFVVLLLINGGLSSSLRASNNPIEYFWKSSAIRQADGFLNENFAGTGEIHIQVYGKEDDSIKDPEILAGMRAVQDRVDQIEEVGLSMSLADFLKRMHFVMHDQDPAYDRVPGTPEDLGPGVDPADGRKLVSQYLLLYEMAGGSDLARTVDYVYRRANIEINIKSNSSQVFKKIMVVIREAVAENFGPEVRVDYLGSGYINLKIVHYLVRGQVLSLIVSFVVVFLMLAVLFRSLVMALIGVIPLILTVTTNFATMVVTGIPLNMGTALIASVCIGIGVDYSIHFINRYRIESRRTADMAATVRVTMNTSGRAIFLNAIAVGGGFAVLLFSSFMPIVYLGFLMPLIMAVNAIGALAIIPAFLNLLYGKKKINQE